MVFSIFPNNGEFAYFCAIVHFDPLVHHWWTPSGKALPSIEFLFPAMLSSEAHEGRAESSVHINNVRGSAMKSKEKICRLEPKSAN